MNGVPWRDPTYDLVIWVATVTTFVAVFMVARLKVGLWVQADKTARPSEVKAKVRG